MNITDLRFRDSTVINGVLRILVIFGYGWMNELKLDENQMKERIHLIKVFAEDMLKELEPGLRLELVDTILYEDNHVRDKGLANIIPKVRK